MRRILTWLLLFSCFSIAFAEKRIEVVSPDGKIIVRFMLDRQGTPHWQITRKGEMLLTWSPLGLEFAGAPSFTSGLVMTDSARTEHDETYTLIAAKTRTARDHYRELRISLRESTPPGRMLDLEFRVFDDGAAFRYLLPAQSSLTSFAIVRELTEFHFPSDLTSWGLHINTFRSSFEGPYTRTSVDKIPDTALVHPPLTMQRADGVTLAITEACLVDYAGMYLRGLPGTALQVVLSPLPDAAPICVRGVTPFVSPWRVVMIGERPGNLIESTIIENLNPPCVLKDVSWIKPGKAIFPWWPDFYSDKPGVPSKMGFENQKYYIDFAADNNLQYLELEPPWYGDEEGCITTPEKYDITKPIPELRLPELFAHARARNIGIFLWNHWVNVERQGDSAFALYKKWGAPGVKIDFMNRDDQEMVRWYQKALKMTADHQLMVYFHGAFKPTGSRRTYPHLVTQEGILGNEQNKVIRLVTPEHTVTIPFTRMLAGPMDFTPGGFRNVTVGEFQPVYSRPLVMGTRCHQLAMFVVYESPLEMVCDDPGAYRNQPGLEFIREVPASWDETRAIDGEIGKFVVLARRSGEAWYVGGMTDESPRDMPVRLSFLGPGKYQAEIFEDGKGADIHPTSLAIRQESVTAESTIHLRMAKAGGVAIAIRRP